MKKNIASAIFLLFTFTGASAQAKDNDTRTETRKCNGAFSLCETVAGDDKRNCERTRSSNCSGNYKEDINQCSADQTSCLKSIGRTTRPNPKSYNPPSSVKTN